MAQPVQDPNKQAIPIPGTGYAATVYDDGTIVVWDIATGQGVANGHVGQEILDLGNGMATAFDGDGNPSEAWSIKAEDQPGYGAQPAPTTAPDAGAGGSRVGQPGDDTNSRVGKGRYTGTYGGQTVPGRKTDIPFDSTVAPSTWNPASPGRNEGWGTIGAGTAGIQYGYGGISGAGKKTELLKINEEYLPHLANPDPDVAPGYIPGSGTYNQYRLDDEGKGLFSTVRGSNSARVVNSRFGLGGTGDPTSGGESQTPDRYITGNMAGSGVSMKGDEDWRKKYGGGGGGLMGLASNYMAGVTPVGGGGDVITPDPSTITVGPPGSGGGAYGQGGGTGGGTGGGGGFFGAGPGYSPEERGALWGKDEKTKGLDYLVTLFMRSDTPTGIGTPAWDAPKEMWDGLLSAIRDGIITVKNPDAWKMIQDKTGATPQSIGGKATNKDNIQPNGQAGTGAGGADTGGTEGVSGTFEEGEETPFGVIKGGLPQGFAKEWHDLLLAQKTAAGQQAVEEAKLSGQFNGLPTLEAQKLAETIKDNAEKNAIARINADATMKQALTDEAFKNAQTKQNQARLEGDLKKMEEDIAVKREEIASIAATGDKDRAQRETESLREMEAKREELSGYINGVATLEREKFQAEQQQLAYERAANPARAYENELARGNTGWNAPMEGPWGTTTGTPSAQMALGQGAGTQAQGMPAYNYGQPISGQYPGNVTGQPLPGQPQAGAGQQVGITDPGYQVPDPSQKTGLPQVPQQGTMEQMPQVVDDTNWTPEQRAAYAQQQQAAYAQAVAARQAAGQQQQAQAGQMQNMYYDPSQQGAATPTGSGPVEQVAGQAYAGNGQGAVAGAGAGQTEAGTASQATQQYAAQAQPAQQTQQAQAQPVQQPQPATATATTGVGGGVSGGTPYPGYGAPAANWGYGNQGAAGLGQPTFDQTPIRQAAGINAFKAGAAMPTAGQYGVSSTVETGATAGITGRDMRLQNLKQTRRMSPLMRQLVGSAARFKGVDDDTTKMYSERGAPKATQSAGSYAMK